MEGTLAEDRLDAEHTPVALEGWYRHSGVGKGPIGFVLQQQIGRKESREGEGQAVSSMHNN